MANPRVLVSYNPRDHEFAMQLANNINKQGVEVVMDDLTIQENRIMQELLSCQWLVLVLTPEVARLPRMDSIVQAALQNVLQQRMQGVLAVAAEPVEPEMLLPLWSTIRTYSLGQSEQERQEAFEKVARTLGYTSSAHAISSSGNWASTYSYNGLGNSHLSVAPTRRSPSILMIAVMAILVLLIALTGVLLESTFLKRPAAIIPSFTPTLRSLSSATPNATATATMAIARAQDIYTASTKGQPTFVMKAQDATQQWDQQAQNPLCVFNSNGTYQVTNKTPGHYTPCMARKMTLKNFTYQVQMEINQGGYAGGLIFRSDDSSKTSYRFSLDTPGDYGLFICNKCSDTTIGDVNSALAYGNIADKHISIGQSYMLTVIAKDNTIYLYVGNTFIDQVKNTAIPGPGEIGVYAASINQVPTEVVFSNVKVWQL